MKQTLLGIIAVLMLSACNLPATATPAGTVRPVNLAYTAAAQTVAAELTRAASGLPSTETPTPPSPQPQGSPTPLPPPTATASPTRSPTPVCDLAYFVADVTVPDGTQMLPGQEFVKTWRLRNMGTCTWDTSYRLVFYNGDAMGAPPSLPLPGSVPPGQEVDLSITFTAPAQPGTYRSEWKLRNPSGVLFGVGGGALPFWVEIVVVEPTPTWTPSPTATHTPTATPVPSNTPPPHITPIVTPTP